MEVVIWLYSWKEHGTMLLGHLSSTGGVVGNRVVAGCSALITPRACTRGKAIGFVCLFVCRCRVSPRKLPDLKF